MLARRLVLTLAVASAVVGIVPAIATACTVTWDDGAGDRRWSSAQNWSGNAVPGSTADVCIGPLSGGRIVAADPVSVATVESEHLVELRSSFTGRLSIGEYVLADGASLLDATVAEAVVRVDAGDTAQFVGGEIADGSLIAGEGDLVIAPPPSPDRRRALTSSSWTGGSMGGGGGTIVAPGATLILDPGPPVGGGEFPISAAIEDRRSFSNGGSMTWQSGLIGINGHATFDNSGTLTLASSTGRWTDGPNPVVNTGLITKTGTSTVDFPGVDNDGTISVSRGVLQMSSLLSTVDSRTEVSLGGTTAGLEHGVVAAHSLVGTARLAGTLEVRRSAGYTPDEGDVFGIVEAAVVKGSFPEAEGLGLGGGMELVPDYAPTSVTLTATDVSRRGQDAPAAAPGAPAAVGPPPLSPRPGTAALQPPSAGAALLARDDTVRRRARRIVRYAGLLGNDVFPAGTRVELAAPPRRASVVVNPRTGALRIRLRSRARRSILLRYRLVAPGGHRSLTAAVRITLRQR